MSVLMPLLGAGVGVGLLLIVAGLRRAPAAARRRRAPSRTHLRTGVAAAAGGMIVLVVTRWPVLAALTVLGIVTVPRLLSGGGRRATAARSEAVAQWIEMLRDTMAGAAGLEEAIAVTARRPPPAIAPAIARLAARLEHQTLPRALRGFATDVADPTADLLVAALVTAATNETRDLGRLLAALVEATRAQVQMRASVDAGRAQVRSAARLVIAITLLFTAALLLFSREYLAPYATVEGQLWLAIVGGVFAASLVLLARLDRIELPARPLLTGDADDVAGTVG